MRIFLCIVYMFSFASFSNAQVIPCEDPYSSVDLDINNVRAKIRSSALHFWDYTKDWNGYEIPKGSGKTSSFSNGVWFGGTDIANNLYVAANARFNYGDDFFSGPLNDTGGTTYNDCLSWDRVFSVYGEEIVNHKKRNTLNYNIYKWPGDYAPYYDTNADGIYDPSKGDYPILDYDHPNLIPGQMAFWIFNDVGNYKSNSNSELPLKIEVQATAYAFKSEKDAINNSTFFKYKIINKSNNIYYNFKFAYFSDFEIGNWLDDYSGCDLSTNINGVKRNLFYKYNSDNNDEGTEKMFYGQSPPAIGLIYLDSKKSKSLLKNNHISSFVAYDEDCTPCLPTQNTPELFWRYMNGIRVNLTGFRYGTEKGLGNTGAITQFLFPGDTDPSGRPAWYETGAPMKDPWLVSTISGITFQPGEMKEVDLAIAWARDTPGTNLTSLEKLRLTSDSIHTAFDNQFAQFSTGINNQRLSNFNIYPNPAKEIIFIKGDSKQKNIKIKIYNLTGVLVKEVEVNDSDTIDISQLPIGTYIVTNGRYSVKLLKL